MIEFRKPSEFTRGTLYNQLVDAYSLNDECNTRVLNEKKLAEAIMDVKQEVADLS